jgi:hypothetical protein
MNLFRAIALMLAKPMNLQDEACCFLSTWLGERIMKQFANFALCAAHEAQKKELEIKYTERSI